MQIQPARPAAKAPAERFAGDVSVELAHLALAQFTEHGDRVIWLDHVSTDEYLAALSRVRQPTRGTR